MVHRALLIGGTGFVGRHLARQLADRYEVAVSGRAQDIRNAATVRNLVESTRPDLVVNLAALTTVRETFQHPRETYEVGLVGLLNLLEALKTHGFRGRFLEISSSEIYGIVQTEQLPIVETEPLRPESPYSVAKIAAESLCYQWHKSEGLDASIARPFTHIGPGQSDRFSVAHFVRQVAEIMVGTREPVIHVGDLTTTRDLTDVRDVVRAYDAILHFGKAGVPYNICSGRETLMRDVLDELIRLSGLPITVMIDQDRLRRTEQRRLLGSYAALAAKTGWKPEIPLASTLQDMLLYTLKGLSNEPG